MRWLLGSLLLMTATLHAQTWQQITDFPGLGRDDAAAFSIGTKIYIGTGYQTGWVLATDWYSNDIIGFGSGWMPVAPLPASPRQYCVGIDGGYLFGGLDANGALNELWKYEPSTNSWSQLASLPAPGRYAATALVSQGSFFIANGMLDNGVPTNELWEYQPLSDTWIPRSPVPGTNRHRACSFIGHIGNQQYGYVAGGADSIYNSLKDVWRYEFATDDWTIADSLPAARYGAKATWVDDGNLGGPMVIAGASNDSTFHSNAFVYDYLADDWTDLGQVLPYGIRGGAMAYAQGGGGWYGTIFGTGIDSSFIRHQECYLTGFAFSIEENGITSLTLSPNPGFNHFTLISGGNEQNTELTITDATGRIVQQRAWRPDDPTVNTGSWPSGIYYISLQNGRSRSTAKWIKLADPQ